ncbi:MAG: hypothetical protein HY810_09100 [Candidatus Omnitrophica bacterium]|nr:hypothetical protein [Candidatus Omnitrophota bacterium]
MGKKFIVYLLAVVMVMGIASVSFSQENKENQENKIVGIVQEVAEDGTYVIVDGKKVSISEEVKDYNNMEQGDEVELIIEETQNGPVVVDFNYL